jgi:hypothetical protein
MAQESTIEAVDITTEAIREQLGAATRALAVAHDASLTAARESVLWERRGPLRRLVRRANA